MQDNLYGDIMHILENIGFLRMVVFMNQPLYGQILVELVENWNDCQIFLGGDIHRFLVMI